MELEIRFCYLASASSVTPKSPPLVLASVNAVRACNFKCSFKLQYCDISWFIMVKTVDKNNLLQPTHFHPPLTPICTIISPNSIHIFHLFVENDVKAATMMFFQGIVSSCHHLMERGGKKNLSIATICLCGVPFHWRGLILWHVIASS